MDLILPLQTTPFYRRAQLGLVQLHVGALVLLPLLRDQQDDRQVRHS